MIEQTDRTAVPPIRPPLHVSIRDQVDRLSTKLASSCDELAALQHPSKGSNAAWLFAAEALVMAVTQTARELALCAEEAQDAHDHQTRFLAMIAHELRNPLTPIRTAAFLLGSTRMDRQQLHHIQSIIESQITHIVRLTDDLMDVSRSSSGDFRLKRSRIDMAHVLERTVQMCKPIMDKRGQRLTVRTPRHPIRVNGDDLRLIQVFSNLLDNASKYTPNGGEIWLTMTQQGPFVSISVADTGMGISAQTLPLIFDLFAQGPAAAGEEHRGAGFGIGLYVVRRLVEAHGGRVTAHSTGPHLGSEFLVTLPCESHGTSILY